MRFSELNWPRGLNLGLLKKSLTEKGLEALILNNLDKDRVERRIVLPSTKCYRKVVAYFFGNQVEEGKMSWDEVMMKIKGSFRTLKELGDSRKKVKLLYQQRKKEIERENEQ